MSTKSKSPRRTSRQIARELYDEQQRRLKAEQALENTQAEIADLKVKVTALEEEIHVLLERISALTLQIAQAEGRPEQMALKLELKVLQERLAKHASDAFGTSRSERRRKEERKQKRRRKSKRPKEPPATQLPIEELIHKRSEEEGDCPRCGDPMQEVDGKTTDHDVVYVVQRKYKIRRHRSQHYRCNCCGTTRVAPGAEGLLRKNGKYDVTIAAQVAVDKYVHHLPIERQVKQMEWDGLPIRSQTLWDQLNALTRILTPAYRALHDEVLSAGHLHMDLTPWRLMNNKGGSKMWHLASLSTDRVAWFAINPKKNHKVVAWLLKGFDGIVVSDGDPAIQKLERARSRKTLDLWKDDCDLPDYLCAGCWFHGRRSLFEAEQHGAPVGECLDDIATLFHIEWEAEDIAEATGQSLHEVRSRLRNTKSRAIIEKIRKWLDQQSPQPKTAFHKGVVYLRKQWKYLTVFLEHPQLPLDNNQAERSLRNCVLGRKNHYGSRSVDGIHAAELLYSLVGTCMLRGVDPYEYLIRAVRAAQAGEVLLP